jgi:hypothetical protein
VEDAYEADVRETYKRFVEYENVLAKVGAKAIKCDEWMNAQFTVFNGAEYGGSLTQVDTLADAYKVCRARARDVCVCVCVYCPVDAAHP